MIKHIFLHNCMLDSMASTNVMDLKVINQLGLKITIPYRNVCGIDLRAIPICGLIKYIKVILATYLDISLLMNFVVTYVPYAWGMLLSRKWAATLGGNLQMELSHAIVSTLDEDFVTLYREPLMRYQVEYPQDITNELICVDEGVGNLCVLANFIVQEEEKKGNNDVWTLYFDGSHSSLRHGADISLVYPMRTATFFSYRILFDCTNNIKLNMKLLLWDWIWP